MRSTYMISLLGLVLSSPLAAGTYLDKDVNSEFTQGLPDIDPLVGSMKQPLITPEDLNLDIKLDEQAQRELIQLQNQSIGPAANQAQRLRAGQASWVLGLIHLHGAGIPVNPEKAKQLFLRSAAFGQKIASAGLAWCAYDGCQENPDFSMARSQSQALMPVDRARALYMLWLIEEKLRPLHELKSAMAPQSNPVPSPLLQQSADGGNVHAMLELGIYWVLQNEYKIALNWFDRASAESEAAKSNALWVRKRQEAEQSAREGATSITGTHSADALFNRARQFHRGDGVPVNYAEAIRLYRQSESAGSFKARKMLSLIFSRISPDGNVDLIWMRQLADRDVSTIVPKQEASIESTLLQREPTPLVDLMPLRWRKRVSIQSIK